MQFLLENVHTLFCTLFFDPREKENTELIGTASIGRIDAIYSSPMERANTTAQIISQQSGVGPVVTDSRVRERSVGEWSGMTYEEVQQKWPGYLKRRMLPPSYETDDMVLPRVFLALDNIRKKHPGENVALVCHAGIIYAVEAYLKAQVGSPAKVVHAC